MLLFTRYGLLIGLITFLSHTVTFAQTPVSPQDTLAFRAEQERQRLQDPALGRVPYERLDEARQQILKRSTNNGAQPQSAIPNVTWQERGPNNAGGRTRAILFDPNDATHKKVWAGSLVGGLWYTNDITDPNAGWTPVSDSWASNTITALAADPGNPQIMYAGTGDQYDYRAGGGIWKTTDGGTNWTRLTATIPNSSASSSALASAFTFISRLAVNQSGHVFAGTQLGVVRSTDGGASWSKVLAPNQGVGFGTATGNTYNDQVTDLEIGTDNTVFVAFNPSRVFRSTDAGAQSWKEITPPNTTGERTELALFPASSGALQIVYAVSRKYNASQYSRDISWFKRSVDGGDNWSDITIPTDAYNAMFTSGNGSYAMSLSVDPTNSNRVYAGGFNWYQSADGGATWSGPILQSSVYQHNIQFQPGSNTAVALSGDNGVSLSTDWTTATTPTVASRNTGYRVAEMASVSQKPTPGNPYLLGTYLGGAYQQTTDGLTNSKLFFPTPYSMGLTFIDDDTPSIQLFVTGGGSTFLYDGESSTQYLFGAGYTYADYDSQANTLYAAVYTSSGYFIRRVAGIGSTLTTTDLPLSGLTNSPTLVRLSRDRTALFVGTYNGKLYKVTNLNQSTPTVTAIDNGALPQYSNPSALDIGADDNELIVTLSNFGVQSVWYTRDGGQTWMGKDQSNYGLPDMPVRSVLFNPQNRKQVMLGTELGIWSTNDITATNPGWEPTTSGMGLVKVNQLRVRAPDNRITAATAGRGVFISDALAIPYTLPSITLTNVSNNKLCAGSQVSVSFSTSGPAFDPGNRFTVYLSDATGSFTNQTRIGSGTSSPITVTLPNGYPYLPYGTGYRIRVASANPEVYSGASESLAIGDLTQSRIANRPATAGYDYGSSSVCPGSQVTLNARGLNSQGVSTTVESVQWSRNGSAISGATTSTYQAQQTGTYTATVQQAGCSVTSGSHSIYSVSQPTGTIQSPTGGAPVCMGQTIPATCTNASDNATFQWRRDGSIISGATSYSLGISQTGTYQCKVTDANCTANTNTMSISFQFGSALTASIQSLQGDSLLCPGSGQYVGMGWISNGFFANESAYYSYQWYRDNVAIAGATGTYFASSSAGLYSLSVRQGGCATRSNGIVVRTVTPFPPVISVSGNTRPVVCTGDTRNLMALPSGGTFQWQRDGVDIAGASGTYYMATASGSYTVRTTGSSCAATSAPLSFTFGSTAQPRIAIDPQSGPGCRSVLLSQPAPQAATNYQWLLNGSPLPGATNSTLTVTGGGLYALQLTNGACSGTSNPVSVVFGTPFNQPVKPVIQRAKSTALCAGGAVRLVCNAYTTLQWKRNGQVLANTGSTFFATQTGLYTVVATDNTGCSAESDPIDVRIGESVTAQLPGNSRISTGQSAQIPVLLSGPAPWSFTLTNGQTVQNTYQNPHILSVSPTMTTSYQLASVANGCGTGTVQGNPTTVFVSSGSADVSLQTRVSTRTPNVGDEVEYTLTLTNDGPQDAAGVQITSRLPGGLAFSGTTAGTITMTDSLVRGDVGTIGAGSTAELRYKARVMQAGAFATATQISASQTPDPDSQPNSGTGDGQDDAATTDLRTASGSSQLTASTNPGQTPLPQVSSNQPAVSLLTADLSLALYTDTSLPQPGDVINVRAVVSNRGGSVATSVAVQTLLPDGWTLANTNNVASSQNGASTVYANEVPAGSSVTLLFIVKVGSSSGTVQSQIASVVETDPDSTPGNGYANGEDDTASLMIRTR